MDTRALAAARLHDVHEGPAWHGPSLKEALAGVDATLAVRRPPHGGHTIWELAAHVGVWADVCRRRLQGEVIAGLPPAEDFPPAGAGDEAWRALLADLDRRTAGLRAAIKAFPASRLEEIVPAKDYTFATMIHGAPDHTVYHAGQIALLKKILSA